MADAGQLNIIKKTFNLKACFEEVKRIMKAQVINKQVKFHCYFDQRLPLSINSDQERLKRIILNLLLNAQKYTQTGFIKFSIKYVKNLPSKTVKLNASPRKVVQEPIELIRFEISDTGIGIQEEKLQYIFNLFESDINELNI